MTVHIPFAVAGNNIESSMNRPLLWTSIDQVRSSTGSWSNWGPEREIVYCTIGKYKGIISTSSSSSSNILYFLRQFIRKPDKVSFQNTLYHIILEIDSRPAPSFSWSLFRKFYVWWLPDNSYDGGSVYAKYCMPTVIIVRRSSKSPTYLVQSKTSDAL